MAAHDANDLREASCEAAMTRHFAQYAAHRDLLLYHRTGEAGFVWRAYGTYRQLGLEIPDTILTIFDGWAAQCPTPKSARTMLNAERNLDIVQQLHILDYDLDVAPNHAARTTAEDFSLSFENVKVVKSRWYAQCKPSAHSEAQLTSEPGLEQAWRGGSVTRTGEVT